MLIGEIFSNITHILLSAIITLDLYFVPQNSTTLFIAKMATTK